VSTVLLTGASGNIGRLIGDRLVARDARLISIGRSAHPAATHHVTANFENPDQLERACASLETLQCDGLVCAAGLDSRADAINWEVSALMRILSVNAISHAILLRQLIRVAGGRNLAVVALSTSLIKCPEPKSFLYTASKFLLEALLGCTVAEGAPCAVSILRFGYVGVPMRETAEGEQRVGGSAVARGLKRRVADAAVERALVAPTRPSVSIVDVQ